MKTYVAIVTDTFSNQCRDGSGLQCEFIHQNVSWLNSQSGRLSRRKLDHSWAHTQRWSRFHPPKKWTTGLQHTRGSTTAAVCHLRTPHAPRVYAFDKDKILMEKCAPLQEIHHKTFLDWLKTVFNFSNFEKRSFNSMPSRGHWPPADSWHELRPVGAIVQIDFDEMKFQTATQYTTFQKLYPGKHTTRVLTNAPKDPPHYYWWADSILNEKDQKSWPRQKWLDEIVTMKQLYRDIEDEIHSFLEETLQKRQIRLHSRVKETQGRSSLRQARPTSQV